MSLCYVGKATKIFLFLIGAVLLVGLVVGLRLLRHGSTHKIVAQPCQPSAAGCRPFLPQYPLPADGTPAAPAIPSDAATAPLQTTTAPLPTAAAAAATASPLTANNTTVPVQTAATPPPLTEASPPLPTDATPPPPADTTPPLPTPAEASMAPPPLYGPSPPSPMAVALGPAHP